MKTNIMKTTLFLFGVSLSVVSLQASETPPSTSHYRCMAQCFVLDFNQGSAQSLGIARAESQHRSDAFLIAGQRCQGRAKAEGLKSQDAFLVTSLGGSHSIHDASSRTVHDSSLQSSFEQGSALVVGTRRFFRTRAIGIGQASSASSAASSHYESTSSEHDEQHEIQADFAKPDLNCEIFERDPNEAPIYGGDLDVHG